MRDPLRGRRGGKYGGFAQIFYAGIDAPDFDVFGVGVGMVPAFKNYLAPDEGLFVLKGKGIGGCSQGGYKGPSVGVVRH